MLIPLLFLSAAVAPIDWNGFAPALDAMTDHADSIVRAEVLSPQDKEGSDLAIEVLDNGSYMMLPARIAVVETLKGPVQPKTELRIIWQEKGGLPSAKWRLKKGCRYLFFLAAEPGGWIAKDGKAITKYAPIDPITGIMPDDPYTADLVRYHLHP